MVYRRRFVKKRKTARKPKAKPSKAVVRAVKSVINRQVETKFFSFDAVNADAGFEHQLYSNPKNNLSKFFSLSDIAQGTDRVQRIGARIFMKFIKIDLLFSNNHADRANMVRLMVVMSNDQFDNNTNVLNTGVNTDFGGITTNDIYRTVQDQLRQRSTATQWRSDRVLMDRTFVLDPKNTGAKTEHHFKRTVKVGKQLEYLVNQSLPAKNELYMVMNISRDVTQAQAVTQGVEFSGSCTLHYTDM